LGRFSARVAYAPTIRLSARRRLDAGSSFCEVASDAPKKASWDGRFAERLARESWEAANDPARRRNPPFREQIKSPYYWLAILAIGGVELITRTANAGWLYALAAVLYLFALFAGATARRHARAAQDDGRQLIK
jgi:hypothetical protein